MVKLLNKTAHTGKEEKEKRSIYVASFILRIASKVLRHGSHSFTCKLHHVYLSFVSVHRMAPSLTEVANIQLPLTTHALT